MVKIWKIFLGPVRRSTPKDVMPGKLLRQSAKKIAFTLGIITNVLYIVLGAVMAIAAVSVL